jgi:hypothetical protein
MPDHQDEQVDEGQKEKQQQQQQHETPWYYKGRVVHFEGALLEAILEIFNRDPEPKMKGWKDDVLAELRQKGHSMEGITSEQVASFFYNRKYKLKKESERESDPAKKKGYDPVKTSFFKSTNSLLKRAAEHAETWNANVVVMVQNLPAKNSRNPGFESWRVRYGGPTVDYQ